MKLQDSRGGLNRDISKVTDKLTNPPLHNLGDRRHKKDAQVREYNRGKFIASYLLPLTSYLLPLTSYLLPLTSYLLPLTSYLLPLTPVQAGLSTIPVKQISQLKPPSSTLTAKSRSCQTQDIKTLTTGLLQDLPAYANRASQRARRLSRSSDVYSYVILAGRPEFEPLTLGPGVYSPKSHPSDSQVQQVFFTTLERQYTKGKAIELQQFHWVFLTKSQSGWRLATMFSQIGGYPAKKPPTPPRESSHGIIAQAINAWLRDCQAKSP